MKTFRQWLEEKKACESARKWVGDKTLEQAWNECTEPWWMVWLIVATLDLHSSVEKRLVEAGFTNEQLNVTLLRNPIRTCEFLRMIYPLEHIKQEIGEEIQ